MAKKTKKCKICGERKDISLFKTNKKTKDGVISICKECSNLKRNENKDNIKHDNFYLYKLLDKDNTVLYVGKTTNINNRIYAHINNHLTWKNPEKFDLYNNVHKIEYCEMESDYHMNIYEIHYICKYKTKFNIDFKSDNNNLFNLPEITWKPYILKSYIDNMNLYYYCNFKMSNADINDKLNIDVEFYEKYIKGYQEGYYIHRTFNPDSYEINSDGGYSLIDDNDKEE